jgi:hypothetical protein
LCSTGHILSRIHKIKFLSIALNRSFLGSEEQNNGSFRLALLKRTEAEWLSGKIQVSKPYEYWLKFNIRKPNQMINKF